MIFETEKTIDSRKRNSLLSRNIATFRFFFSKSNFFNFSQSLKKLFQTKKVTCYNSWFHDESIISIIFILLACMIILLLIAKIENV